MALSVQSIKAAPEHRDILQSVPLFGSRARGDRSADSDFDLLVVLPDGPPPTATSHKAVAGRRVAGRARGCRAAPGLGEVSALIGEIEDWCRER